MRKSTRIGLLAASALLAAACSAPPQEKTRWTQPGSGAEPKSADAAACRADANRRAEREYLLDTETRSDRGFGTPGTVQNDLARRDARRYRQRLFEDCMRGLGYRKAREDPFRAR